uniref:Uncharacterized protein n=1 Tax=Meloidogyne incognita TaxID=6306 RepID=A0A914NMJ1_MELIC
MSLFAKLFRYSKFVELGSVNGQKIVGRIVHRVNDDLYIDFGCKFNAVCKRPKKDSEKYVIGSNVLIRIFDTGNFKN